MLLPPYWYDQFTINILQLIQQAITQSLTLLYSYDTARYYDTIPLLIPQAIMTPVFYWYNNPWRYYTPIDTARY
jgi:hypothetical protein